MATEVSFHFHVADPGLHLCRLLRKVLAMGKKALVLLPEPQIHELDVQLWTFSQEDFIDHACIGDGVSQLQRSRVVLAPAMTDVGHSQVLINTLHTVPEGFERFEKLVEVVSTDEATRAAARGRWRHYTGLGYSLVRHDLSAAGRGAA